MSEILVALVAIGGTTLALMGKKWHRIVVTFVWGLISFSYLWNTYGIEITIVIAAVLGIILFNLPRGIGGIITSLTWPRIWHKKKTNPFSSEFLQSQEQSRRTVSRKENSNEEHDYQRTDQDNPTDFSGA